jgi:hypothetical protein
MLIIGLVRLMMRGYDVVQRPIIIIFPAVPSRNVTNVVAVDEMTMSVTTHLFPDDGVHNVCSVVALRVINFRIGVGCVDGNKSMVHGSSYPDTVIATVAAEVCAVKLLSAVVETSGVWKFILIVVFASMIKLINVAPAVPSRKVIPAFAVQLTIISVTTHFVPAVGSQIVVSRIPPRATYFRIGASAPRMTII